MAIKPVETFPELPPEPVTPPAPVLPDGAILNGDGTMTYTDPETGLPVTEPVPEPEPVVPAEPQPNPVYGTDVVWNFARTANPDLGEVGLNLIQLSTG